MPVLYQKMIYRDDLRRNPSVLYLFGDNDKRAGLGGQAKEMRGEPNAVGLRTKRAPGKENDDYWSDKNFDANCAKIEEDMSRVRAQLRRGGVVVIPTDGIGTNRADMERRCPRSFHVLQQTLAALVNVPVTVST
jgi:hypothetical protein